MLRGPRRRVDGPPVADLVVGAIGRPERRTLKRLERALDASLTCRVRTPHALLMSAGPVETWRDDASQGLIWSSHAQGPHPRGWEATSQERLAAGLVVDPTRAWLHADGLGLADVFVRRLGGAVYFSNRLAPLAVLNSGPLTADLDAWASILSSGSPVGDRTPYVEIRRVPAATALVWDGHRLTNACYTPRWADLDLDPSITAGEVADALLGCFPSGFDEVEVPLTGGWDSRLLAGVALRHGHRVRAWTTTGDTGEDLDLRLAAPVAEALGVEHRILLPTSEQWCDEVEGHRRRLEHRTWYHVGLAPLARAIGAERGTVLDGLGGDVLIKGPWATRKGRSATNLSMQLWRAFGGAWRLESALWTDRARRDLQTRSQEEFASVTRRWRNHPQADTLSAMSVRTSQVTSLSPLGLFAPESRVHLPLLHPDVISLLLRIPPQAKREGALYRDVLELLLGGVGLLPSTNDRAKARRSPSTQTTSRAIERLDREISASAVARHLMVDGAIDSLKDPTTGAVRLSGSVHLLQSVALLADWEKLSPRPVRFPGWPY